MQTVLMAIALIKNDDSVLLRKMDPARNPYQDPWGLFGGRLEGEGSVENLLNAELKGRWNITVAIKERLWWGEDQKKDHDGEEKLFLYIDALCEVASGEPSPINNPNEKLEWVKISELGKYNVNPPTKLLFERMGYLK